MTSAEEEVALAHKRSLWAAHENSRAEADAIAEATPRAALDPNLEEGGGKTRLGRAQRALRKAVFRRVYRPLSRLLARRNVKFVFSERQHAFGHQIAEIDFLLKEIELGRKAKARLVMLARRSQVANPAVLELWRPKMRVVANPLLVRLLAPFQEIAAVTYATTKPFIAFDEASPYPALLADWGERPPVALLPDWMRVDGAAALRRWGMRDGGWFVALHCREGGFHADDEIYNDYRNARIENYVEAMREIVGRGGFVVRVGDPSMTPLPAMEGVYDYAHSPERRPHLDLFLGAACRFFIGNTSGPATIPVLFNVPSALANLAPCGMAPGIGPRDLSILKLLKNKAGQVISYRAAFAMGMSRWRLTQRYAETGVEVVENTPDEIRDLVVEMFDRLEGRFEPSADYLALHEAFLGLMRPRDYAYGSKAQIASSFLKKHANLI